MKKIIMTVVAAAAILTTSANAKDINLKNFENVSIGAQVGQVNSYGDIVISSKYDYKLHNNISLTGSTAVSLMKSNAEQNVGLKYNFDQNVYIATGAGYETLVVRKTPDSVNNVNYVVSDSKRFYQPTVNLLTGINTDTDNIEFALKKGYSSFEISLDYTFNLNEYTGIFISLDNRVITDKAPVSFKYNVERNFKMGYNFKF